MDLARIRKVLERHPSVRLAARADNEAILRFYDRTALSGETIRLRSVRSPDFFRFLDLQSDQYAVFLYEEGGEVQGLATICFRAGYIGGKREEIAYLGDFRVGFSRKAIRLWRACYADLLREMDLPAITAVIDENTSAQRALIAQTRAGFRYDVLVPYRMVNVLGRKFWRPQREQELEIRHATASDRKGLLEFLDRQEARKPFGYVFSDGELDRRLAHWPDLSLGTFLLALDGGRIAGCLAPWWPASAKVNVIERMPGYLSLLAPFVRIPKMGMPLEALYLTHLAIEADRQADDRRLIFRALLDRLYREERLRSLHMISFCDFSEVNLSGALGDYWIQSVPMKLYTVSLSDQVSAPVRSQEAGFEIALV